MGLAAAQETEYTISVSKVNSMRDVPLHKKSIPAAAESAATSRIVSEARRYYMAHGFRGVTMDDLSSELGMSKKTLYAHFRSKTALVEAVILDKATGLEAELGR